MCVCVFSVEKYRLIGTLTNDCSCHSNVNSAAAGGGGGGGDGTPVHRSEGISAAATPPSSSSGICAVV